MLKNKIYADEGDRIFEMVRSRLYINSMRGTMVKVNLSNLEWKEQDFIGKSKLVLRG
ncbi:MAG: hypothetical protein V7K27_12835 [Nostoc sp.]|uniref:hypothetical protein n=1 Tax=Nostoc sp. TaxID=1180 RepID=UPI002FF66D38